MPSTLVTGECFVPSTFPRWTHPETLFVPVHCSRLAKHLPPPPPRSFEILSSFFWSSPSGFYGNGMFVPYFYVIFLTILLVDRSFRDDDRCRKKYGKDWEKYEETVKVSKEGRGK